VKFGSAERRKVRLISREITAELLGAGPSFRKLGTVTLARGW